MGALKSMLLDLKACKVYWKNIILVLFVLGLFVINMSKSVDALFLVIFLLFLPLWQYPFAAYDKCSLLYLSLPQKKSDIVLGRYLLAVLGIVFAFILSACIGLICDPQSVKNGDMFLIASVSTLFIAVLISIQAPIFFKFGYMRSRIFAFLSLGIIAGLIGFALPEAVVGKDISSVMEMAKSPLIPVILLIISAIIVVVSYCISLAVFEKREG